MPADPLLDRDLAKAITSETRDVGRAVLREVIDYGLRAFERCSNTAEGHDTPTGSLFPMLHVFEMLDGVEVLLDAASVVPTTVVLRAAFEAMLAMEYVVQQDSERRGAAYVVAEIHSRVTDHDRFNPKTGRGKAFGAALRKDPVGQRVKMPVIGDPEGKRADLLAVIAQPHLVAAADEYERTKTKLRRVPPFYALWDGPADIEQLARHLDRLAFYEILYRSWSKTAHASDLSRQLTHIGGIPAVRRLRDGDRLTDAYGFAIYFGVEAIRLMLGKYRAGELDRAFPEWYREKVSPGYRRLTPRPEPPIQGAV